MSGETGPRMHPGEEGGERSGLLKKIREGIYNVVTESRIPSADYKSTLGVWGGKLVQDAEGRLVYDNRGVVSRIDRFGDAVLRSFDDHMARDPVRLAQKHPAWALRLLMPGTKRYRGDSEEVLQNVARLGLEEYYGSHKQGIGIKKPELYTQGRALIDIYRADLVNSDKLSKFDRFSALGQASSYLGRIHRERGAIGEANVASFIFEHSTENEVSNPVINLPTIVFNADKHIGEVEKKATDLLDFLMSIGVEEYRRSQNWGEVQKALEIILDNYGDKKVIQTVASFARRGRLTLQGDESQLELPANIATSTRPVFSQHNKARLGVKESFSAQLRSLVVKVTTEHAGQSEH